VNEDVRPEVSFDDFRDQWLESVRAGDPSTVQLGNRFASKLVTQWLDIDEGTDGLVYCDGAGDGGIDVAFLDRQEESDSEADTPDVRIEAHDTWYLVQSKYGKAFSGPKTLLEEGQKVIDTLDGKRERLSSLAQDVLEMLSNFRARAADNDRIVLVFATEQPLNEVESRVLLDLRAMGKQRLGALFDVDSVSIETIYRRTLQEAASDRTQVTLKSHLVESGEGLLLGSTPLLELYNFLKQYRAVTNDLDQLYEKNVRRFLGIRRKVNRAIAGTLQDHPDKFGLFNNGITIVVEDFRVHGNGTVDLIEPFVVNGCQTTRTIWEVFYKKLESGGTGRSSELEKWQERAQKGVVVTKIVRVGTQGEVLLRDITRHTNTQNAIREKDFLALTSDFRNWAKTMEASYNVFLEIQRGGWDSRKALQKRRPDIQQFTEAANAFNLLKVYGAGWLGEAGVAFGKNAPFLPSGSVFKKIINGDNDGESLFGVDDLYAAYRLQKAADGFGFGRGADQPTRRQTRFLFYSVVIDLLKDVMSRNQISTTNQQITQALLKLYREDHLDALQALLDSAVDVIDGYLMIDGENSVFAEPKFGDFVNDLNAFLKWDKLGKSSADTPRLRTSLEVAKMAMAHKVGGSESVRERVAKAIAVAGQS